MVLYALFSIQRTVGKALLEGPSCWQKLMCWNSHLTWPAGTWGYSLGVLDPQRLWGGALAGPCPHKRQYLHLMEHSGTCELPWWLSGKESTCQYRTCRFYSWVGKIPWRRKWPPTPVFLLSPSTLAAQTPWSQSACS